MLVVDDNEDAAVMLGMLLEASGHEVKVAHRPQHALTLAREQAPTVCILDIGLPDMDGYELARRLRRLPETAGALMIAVTGYGQQNDRALAVAPSLQPAPGQAGRRRPPAAADRRHARRQRALSVASAEAISWSSLKPS
ncbi:response regulator [Massilia sp. H-1]|nr:response regulator [Massilia sp. H-1]